MKITIKTYAAVKEYFPSHFEVDTAPKSTINDLKRELIRRKPESGKILDVSRFAVNDSFVAESATVDEHHIVCIIPPSSGG